MNPRFDLVDIARTLQRKARYILIVTVLAAVLGTVFYLIQKKKYKATSEFLVSNPQYTDRHNLFRTDRAQFIQYFGTEDDIDKVMAIAKSELTKGRIIANTHLAQVYKLDTASDDDMVALAGRFNKHYDAKRTEYQNMEVSYTDPDPKVAADVTNEAVRVIGDIYGGYFSAMRGHAEQSIQSKIGETDSAIAVLTDSLANMRDRYHIYDILSPSRQTIINSSVGHGGGAGYDRAIEEIQNIESIKDRLVMDRANYVTNINEFNTGTKAGELPLIQVISQAYPPTKPSDLGFALTVLACALAGCFFSALWVLLVAYFRNLTAVQR